MNAPNKLDLFSIFIPFQPLQKDDDAPNPARLPVRGVMSVQSPDYIDEVLDIDGMDVEYLLKDGHLNYEHTPGVLAIVGCPLSVEKTVDENGVKVAWFEGYLYGKDPLARSVYDKAMAMSDAGNDRHLGYSIEGYTVARNPLNPKHITKSKILNLTITAHPCHPDARLEALAMSLLAKDTGNVADIGMQTPATGGGELAPLVTQDVGQKISYATPETKVKGKSVEEISALVCEHFQGVAPDKAQSFAVALRSLLGC